MTGAKGLPAALGFVDPAREAALCERLSGGERCKQHGKKEEQENHPLSAPIKY